MSTWSMAPRRNQWVCRLRQLTPAQIKERWPLIRTDDLEGAIYHPTDGYINPADVTMAMAKGARQRGVEIIRKRQVDSL